MLTGPIPATAKLFERSGLVDEHEESRRLAVAEVRQHLEGVAPGTRAAGAKLALDPVDHRRVLEKLEHPKGETVAAQHGVAEGGAQETAAEVVFARKVLVTEKMPP